MADVNSNFFEIQRRGYQWSKNSTLDDEVTSMNWDSNPNNVVNGDTPGETKLYSMPIGSQFFQSNGVLWLKTESPNKWVDISKNNLLLNINNVQSGNTLVYSGGLWVNSAITFDLSDYYTKLESNSNFLSANTNLDFSSNFLSANTSFYTQDEVNFNFLSANTSFSDLQNTAHTHLKSNIIDFNESDYVHVIGDETIDGNKTFNDNVYILSDLYVNGSATTIYTTDLKIKDNLITINSGETGSGVSKICAGVEIDRGLLVNYLFEFNELNDTFRVGESGSTQAVATREDNPSNSGVSYWDDELKRFDTNSNFVYLKDKRSLNIGTSNTINGSYSIALGQWNIVNGDFAFCGGNGNFPRNYSNGEASFVYSIASTVDNGCYSSVILGGSSHIINSGNSISAIIGGSNNEINHQRSVILGGSSIISDADDTVYGVNFKAVGGFMSANTYYGDGSNLTGINVVYSLSALTDTNLNNIESGQTLIYNNGIWTNSSTTIDLSDYYTKLESNSNFLSANTNLDFSEDFLSANTFDSIINTTDINSSGNITATTYYGDGSNLTGVIADSSLSSLNDTNLNNIQSGETLIYNNGFWYNSVYKLPLISGNTGQYLKLSADSSLYWETNYVENAYDETQQAIKVIEQNPINTLDTDPELLVYAQNLTDSYVDFGSVIDTDGYNVLGLFVEADVNDSENVYLKLKGLFEIGGTEYKIKHIDPILLWSTTTESILYKYYELDIKTLPYVKIQAYAETTGSTVGDLTIHFNLKYNFSSESDYNAAVTYSLSSLTDVDISTLSQNQILQYSGTTWQNADVVEIGDEVIETLEITTLTATTIYNDIISATTFYGDGSNLTGIDAVSSLSALTDTNLNNIQSGETLVYNNGIWTNSSTTIDLSDYYTKLESDSNFLSASTNLDFYTQDEVNSNFLSANTFDSIINTTDINSSGVITATTYYGDGSNLTGINVVSSLSSLTDVDISTLSQNQILQYSGTTWQNADVVEIGDEVIETLEITILTATTIYTDSIISDNNLFVTYSDFYEHTGNTDLHLTSVQNDAMDNSNSPSSSNPFATISDISASASGLTRPEADLLYVFKTGDTMTGPLTINDDINLNGNLIVSASTLIDGVDVSELYTDFNNLTANTYTKTEIDSNFISANTAIDETYYENTQTISSNSVLDSFNLTTGNGSVWYYSVKNGSNLRVGSIYAVWDISTSATTNTEFGTDDLGNTSGITFDVDINSSNVRLNATILSGSWDIKIKRNIL